MNTLLNQYRLDHFTLQREHLESHFYALFIYTSIFLALFDVYRSFQMGHYSIVYVELSVVSLLFFIYLFTPRFISLPNSIYISLCVVTLLVLMAFVLPVHNQEFILFLLAYVPAYLFFFLDLASAIRWVIGVFIVLFVITLVAYMDLIEFGLTLMIQVLIGYTVLSYFHYTVEKERIFNARSLKSLLESNKSLLKEVHHRAKNNLQVVMGMLESQAFRVEDPKCKKLLTSQRYRLQTMSLAHNVLEGNPTSSKVDISIYLKKILENIKRDSNCVIESDIDSITLDMPRAMNVGLFFNEALTNAVTHAYDKEVNGSIEVSFKCENEECTLRVKDFGKGFDTTEERDTMGMLFMKDVSRFMNNGQMNIDTQEGTEVSLNFLIQNIKSKKE